MKELFTKNKTEYKYLIGSFITTIVVVAFFVGVVTVDFRCKKTTTGEEVLPFEVEEIGEITILHIDTLGLNSDLNISGFVNFVETIAELICIPL